MALDENFTYIVEKFGRPAGESELPSKHLLETYEGKLPNSLIEFWRDFGFGVVLKGYFQFCDPVLYRSIIDNIFRRSDEFKPDKMHVIGFSAFGKMVVWHEKYFDMDIDLVNQEIYCHGYFKPRTSSADRVIGIALTSVNLDSYDEFDADGNGLFKKARARLGTLPFGSIYGFKPALALGGPCRLENLTVYSALEHMSFLSQLGPMRLIDNTKRG